MLFTVVTKTFKVTKTWTTCKCSFHFQYTSSLTSLRVESSDDDLDDRKLIMRTPVPVTISLYGTQKCDNDAIIVDNSWIQGGLGMNCATASSYSDETGPSAIAGLQDIAATGKTLVPVILPTHETQDDGCPFAESTTAHPSSSFPGQHTHSTFCQINQPVEQERRQASQPLYSFSPKMLSFASAIQDDPPITSRISENIPLSATQTPQPFRVDGSSIYGVNKSGAGHHDWTEYDLFGLSPCSQGRRRSSAISPTADITSHFFEILQSPKGTADDLDTFHCSQTVSGGNGKIIDASNFPSEVMPSSPETGIVGSTFSPSTQYTTGECSSFNLRCGHNGGQSTGYLPLTGTVADNSVHFLPFVAEDPGNVGDEEDFNNASSPSVGVFFVRYSLIFHPEV